MIEMMIGLTRSGGGSEEVVNAVLPLLKFITLSLFGLILSHPRVGLIPKATLRVVSKLVFALFLPCLIFTNLGPSITLSNLLRWWFLPANVLVSAALGCLLGLGVALVCRPPPHLFRFTVVTTAFSNTGNLSLAIVSSVCHSNPNSFGLHFSSESCASSGVAYVALSQWAAAFLVYTLVYHMMEPSHVDGDEIEDEITEVDDEIARPLLVEAEWPGMEEKETEHCKTPLIFGGGDAPEIRTVAERTPIRHMLQPPTVASLLAVSVGVFPKLREFVFDEGSVFSVVTDSLRIMAEAMVPSVMLMVGGMLAEGPAKSGLGRRTTVGIIAARLVVFPAVGVGVVGLADKLGFLVPDDRLFRFVLLLQYTTPSAILLGAVASLRGYAVREAAAVLFWQHVFAVFTLSFYVVLYFKFLL